MQLAALSHNFRGRKKILQFTHFHQFCFNFIGKDEVFHGLLFFYIFVYLYYPMKFKRKFLQGPPPPAPPCFEKSGPPLLKKNWTPCPGLLELAHV